MSSIFLHFVFKRETSLEGACQQLALAAWWEKQLTKRKNASALESAFCLPPSSLRAVLGDDWTPHHHSPNFLNRLNSSGEWMMIFFLPGIA